MRSVLLASLRMVLASILLTGLIYPLAVWVVGTIAFRDRATGSLVRQDGEVVGSELIGQAFESDEYFHSRPSAAEYDASASGPTNLGPTSKDLMSAVKSRVGDVVRAERARPDGVPVDLVTASASGLDPHITPDSAYLQASRVASARGLPEVDVRELVARHVEGRTLGIFGEPRVNVLVLNMALDDL